MRPEPVLALGRFAGPRLTPLYDQPAAAPVAAGALAL